MASDDGSVASDKEWQWTSRAFHRIFTCDVVILRLDRFQNVRFHCKPSNPWKSWDEESEKRAQLFFKRQIRATVRMTV